MPAWFGFCTTADRNRLDSFPSRCDKRGFWSSNNTPCISTIAEDIEDTLFNKLTHYHYHILQSYLPDRPAIDYNLRERHHNKSLILKTADLNERHFLIRNQICPIETSESESTAILKLVDFFVDMHHSSVIVMCDDLQLPIVIPCVHEDGCNVNVKIKVTLTRDKSPSQV